MNIDFFKNKKSFKKNNYQENPDVYWKMILWIVFFIVVISFIYGFFLFLQTNKDFEITVSKSNDNLEKERILRTDKMSNYFNERKNKSIEIINSTSPISDPSL
jgi:uncharacterized ion transporter superfamily protein YfcC